MKKMVVLLSTFLIVMAMYLFASITVEAASFDWTSYYEKTRAKREQREKEFKEKWLDDLEADGNLTQEAIDAAGKYGEGRVPNNTSGKSAKSSGGSQDCSSGSAYTGPGKGWVYSCDELHVIGLPDGENGYTKPGWYGDID